MASTLLLPCCFCHSFQLRSLVAEVSNEAGAGMDGGKLSIMAFGGGKMEMRICEKTRVRKK